MPKNKTLVQQKSFQLACSTLLLILLIALLAPALSNNPNEIHPDSPLLQPLQQHFVLGTDDLGRDLFSRVAIGARISLLIGFLTALVAVCFGSFYGILSAYHEDTLDTPMMRGIDVLYSLPGLMLVVLMSLFFGRGILSLVLVLSLFSWPDTARLIRGQVLSLKREEYIEAFHSLGGKPLKLIFTHFLPNLTPLLLVSTLVTIPRAILTESTLSFIGLGVEPPLSSWGTMASEGWQLVRVAPHLLLVPSLFLILTILALQLIGDALQHTLNPRKSG